jgi:voltage-gated potassium channel
MPKQRSAPKALEAKVSGQAPTLRHYFYELLEHGSIGNRTGLIVNRLLMLLIVVNLAAVTLESMPAFENRHHLLFQAIESLSLIVFSIEYLLRIWVAPEHAPYIHLSDFRARMKFIFSGEGLVDMIAVLPFWAALFVRADLRFLTVFRFVRFLKLVRHSTAMRSLFNAIYSERRALAGSVVILLGTVMIAASIMHLAEGEAQPDKFGTIPDAMWWAIVTLGTVGYGDAVPVTMFGKLVAGITILFGLMMVALPVGIIATAFANEIHRRDFVVTWGMVARFPLFSDLNAAEIADILNLLRAQIFEPGDVIIRRGEAGDSIYFIASGEIAIELPAKRVKLGEGNFFGEMAVLKNTRRSATITALSRTNLLVLAAQDLRALMNRDERIEKKVRSVIRARQKDGKNQGKN